MSTEPELHQVKSKLEPFFSSENSCVFLFGSRASGDAKYNSDWDIGVISDQPIQGARLERARESLDSLRTLHSFDLVDFSDTSKVFREVALRSYISILGDMSHFEHFLNGVDDDED